MTQLAIYPGSFDPITLGHLSVLRRAASVFEAIEVLVVHNPSKAPVFTLEERVSLIEESITEMGIPGRISVSSLAQGLLASHALERGARAIVKGFRTSTDIEYELPMAQVNRDLSGIETVFFASEPGFGFVSSSLVRQVGELGGELSKYVTSSVANALSARGSK